jgi:hypothetical protein
MNGTRPLAQVLAGIRIAIGSLAILTPRLGLRLFGFPVEHDNPTAGLLGRLFGVRNVLLGLEVLNADDDPVELERMAGMNATVDAADALLIAGPLVRRKGLARGGLTAFVTASAVGLGFVQLRRAARS